MAEETLVFIDEGFLDKLTRYFGGGKRIKFDKFYFAEKISKKEELNLVKVFYYTAPPFQGKSPSLDERKRKEGYDRFIASLLINKKILVREGRCQRIIDSSGNEVYKQKGVDTLLAIDLSHIREDYPEIRKIILVSSDTDFCAPIKDIRKRNNIEVILYTYFDRKRGSKFSLSNELISCCSKYVKLNKEDFYDSGRKDEI